MPDYKEMYLMMFRAAEKARRILTEEEFTRNNAQKVVQILAMAQMECEVLYMEAVEE